MQSGDILCRTIPQPKLKIRVSVLMSDSVLFSANPDTTQLL